MTRRISLPLFVLLLGMLLAACGQTEQSTADPAETGGHAHGDEGDDHGHGGHAHDSDAPFDAQFIDGMVVHHQGALDMAQQVLKESQRPELRKLAETILSTQQAEIDQMRTWRKQWYPDLAESDGMDMPMGAMEISSDTNQPFDLRFLEAMISHHQGAVDMAREAQQKAEHAEIKHLADDIIKAQEAEIAQMQKWQGEWFGQ